VPARISREFQYVDMFPDWEAGLERVIAAAKRQNKPNFPLSLAG
jgi:hypothetical protein